MSVNQGGGGVASFDWVWQGGAQLIQRRQYLVMPEDGIIINRGYQEQTLTVRDTQLHRFHEYVVISPSLLFLIVTLQFQPAKVWSCTHGCGLRGITVHSRKRRGRRWKFPYSQHCAGVNSFPATQEGKFKGKDEDEWI